MRMIWESAIQAGDFAGFVPASRGAYCRPLHPRLASLCFLEIETVTDPRTDRRPAAGLSDRERQRPPTGLQPLPTGAVRHGAGITRITRIRSHMLRSSTLGGTSLTGSRLSEATDLSCHLQ